MVKLCFLLLAVLSSSNAVTFQCRFAYSEYLPLGLNYSCEATVIDTGDPEYLFEVTGDHLEGRSNEDVEFLEVLFQDILYRMPYGITKFFPNLLGMEWFSGTLKSLEVYDLQPFYGLTVLSFAQNNLYSLDGDLFRYTPSLQLISFSENRLEHVGFDLFTKLSNLTFANFRYNPCIHFQADTPELILQLNEMLPLNCPPLDPPVTEPTTPDPGDCPVGCLDRISYLEKTIYVETTDLRNEIAELRKLNNVQGETIINLTENVEELQGELNEQRVRLTELERIVEELLTRPESGAVKQIKK